MSAAPASSLAAVMFTDLVDSTPIRRQLTSERGIRVSQGYFLLHERLLTEVAESEGVLTTKWEGDGIMAAFPSASAALAAASAILRRAAAHNSHPLRAADMTVRIGIAVGDVVIRPGDADGSATVEASRLCDAAQGGQVLCTDLVRLLAIDRDDYAFDQAGPMVLKGYEHPVEIASLDLTAATPYLPRSFPERLVDGSGFAFVGRAAELNRLRSSWATADQGRTTMVLLSGDPGVGKSRLAAEAAREATALGSTVLYGRCDPNYRWPYQPFADAIRGYYAAHSTLTGDASADAELGRLLRDRDRRDAGLPAPQPLDRTTELPFRSSSTELARFYEAVVAWLRMASRDQTVVFVIDDIVWADDGSLDLLAYIVEHEPELRTQFVATLRDSPSERSDAAIRTFPRLDRAGVTEWLHLGAMTTGEIRQLVGRWTDRPVDTISDAFCAELLSRSQGIPFYACEVLSWLDKQGQLDEALSGRFPTMSGASRSVPQSIANVAEQRLLLVGPNGRGQVRTAAVIGHHFDARVLELVVEAERQVVDHVLDEAVRAGLVTEESDGRIGRYMFTHDLLRESLLAELTTQQSATLHGLIGMAMEAVHVDDVEANAAEIARHLAFSQDEAARRRAVQLFIVGAEQAMSRAAPAVATELIAQAIDVATAIPSDPRVLADLWYRHGVAQRRSGARGARRTLLEAGERARAVGDSQLAIRAAKANSRGTFSTAGFVDEERVDQLRRALAVVGDGHQVDRASLLAGLGQELTYAEDRQQAVDITAEALDLARGTDDAHALMRALTARHTVLWNPNGLGERETIIEDLRSVAITADDPAWQASAASFGVQNALERGDILAARSHLVRLTDLARDLHQPALTAYQLLWSSIIATLEGELGPAEQMANDAFELNTQVGNQDGQAWLLGQLYPIRWHQGRLDELEPLFAQAFEAFPFLPVLSAALANIYAELGDHRRCRDLLDQVPLDAVVDQRLHLDQLVAVACLVRTARIVDDDELAATMLPLLTPYADQHIINGSVHFGSVEHYIGLTQATLGHLHEADLAFGRAVAMNEALGSPPLVARSKEAHASVLLAGNVDDLARARRLAAEAIGISDRLGLAGIGRDALATRTRVG